MATAPKIRVLILNPNSSAAMTEGMKAAVAKMPLLEVCKISEPWGNF